MGMGERIAAVITMAPVLSRSSGWPEGKGGLAQLLQPGSGPAPDPTAAATALMDRPAMLVNAIPAVPAIPATPAVTLPARDPDVGTR